MIYTNAWMMGGMEQHVLEQARTLQRAGLRIAVICFGAQAIAPLREGLTQASVPVHVLRDSSGLAGRVRRLVELVHIFRRYRDCVVHLSEGWPASDGVVLLAARLANVAGIVRTEHQPPVLPLTRSQRLTVRLKDRLVAKLVYVSSQTRTDHEHLLSRDPKKGIVIRNVVDPSRFRRPGDSAAARRALGVPGDGTVIGVVSRLAEARKGIHHFLDMAGDVAASIPEARFLIVGDGPLRSALEQQAERLGIRNLVTFAGEQEDVPRALRAMDIFVLPSLQEGGPYTLLEALAAGVPVVTTPVGLAPELLADGETALVVPPADPGALARAVIRLASDSDLRSSVASAGRGLVLTQLSPAAAMNEYLDAFRSAAGRHREVRAPLAAAGPHG
ncbi:hypothetical protein AYO38_03435 [bacterium SCGC AG-212-C10]|nr:hypothetical protein AYO38_03435 [bacterium SCGC AG-212-C10]